MKEVLLKLDQYKDLIVRTEFFGGKARFLICRSEKMVV